MMFEKETVNDSVQASKEKTSWFDERISIKSKG